MNVKKSASGCPPDRVGIPMPLLIRENDGELSTISLLDREADSGALLDFQPPSAEIMDNQRQNGEKSAPEASIT